MGLSAIGAAGSHLTGRKRSGRRSGSRSSRVEVEVERPASRLVASSEAANYLNHCTINGWSACGILMQRRRSIRFEAKGATNLESISR